MVKFKISSKVTMLVVMLSLVFNSCSHKVKKSQVGKGSPWDKMDQIISSISEPQFPNKTFNVLDYGAVGDGKSDNTEAFKKAIAKCSEAGGGMVLVPKGTYATGPIHLKSNVNFHLEAGSELRFSTDPTAYPIVHTSFEGIELMNYSPLIYAYQQKNIAVTGKGILNGQASERNWWTWKGSETYGWKEGMPSQLDSLNLPKLMEMAEDGIAVSDRIFGEGHFLRPNLFEAFECNTVMMQGVTIKNAPFGLSIR